MRVFKNMTRFGLLVLLLSVGFSVVSQPPKAAAACAAQPTTYGTVTSTISVPANGTYRVWSRIKAPDSSANSYTLEIDGTTCGVVVGDSAIAANTWTWVDYQSGTANSKVNVTLTAGSHTVTMIGREADVELDRVILTADTSCLPTGTGDLCANPPDTTAPTVAVTAPASGATVTGATTISATANDDVGVTKVEFYVDNVLRATDGSAAYATSFDMATLAIGQHSIYAKAYDAASNSTTSSVVSVTVAAPPDTTKPTIAVTAPAAGATVSGTAALAATASDDVGVTKVEFYVDDTLKATDTSSPYSTSLDTTALPDGAHSITAKASDAANNSATSTAVSVMVTNTATPSDTTAPNVSITNPTANASISGTTAIAVTATDNVGVTKVEFYVDGSLKNSDAAAPYGYNLDTTALSNATHSLTAKAYDAAGNSKTSTGVSVTVANVSYKAADINQDGSVNIQDFSLLASKFGQSGANLGRTDINGDGTVNIQDFSLLAAQFGQ